MKLVYFLDLLVVSGCVSFLGAAELPFPFTTEIRASISFQVHQELLSRAYFKMRSFSIPYSSFFLYPMRLELIFS